MKMKTCAMVALAALGVSMQAQAQAQTNDAARVAGFFKDRVVLEAQVGRTTYTEAEFKQKATGAMGSSRLRVFGNNDLEIGVEVGAARHGRLEVRDEAGDLAGHITGSSVFAGVTTERRLGDFSFGTRVGAHRWAVAGQAQGVGEVERVTGVDPYVGLSLGYHFAGGWRTGVAYNAFYMRAEDSTAIAKSVNLVVSKRF